MWDQLKFDTGEHAAKVAKQMKTEMNGEWNGSHSTAAMVTAFAAYTVSF